MAEDVLRSRYETNPQSGFLSNRYAYEPYKITDGMWRDIGGAVGEAVGKALSPELGPVGQQIAEKIGGFSGEHLGQYIDNADSVLTNAETLMREVNDWQSWHDVMNQWSGGGSFLGR